MEEEKYQFEKVYGRSNRMTWVAFTEISSDFDSLVLLRSEAQTNGMGGVKTKVFTWIDAWFEYRRVPEGINIFVPSMLNCGIDYCNWWEIVDALNEGRKLKQDNPFTDVFYEAIKVINWMEVIKDSPPLDEKASVEEQLAYFMDSPDSRLKEYMRTALLTWAGSRARRNKTPAHLLARKIVKVYLAQIDWENVYEKYKSS